MASLNPKRGNSHRDSTLSGGELPGVVSFYSDTRKTFMTDLFNNSTEETANLSTTTPKEQVVNLDQRNKKKTSSKKVTIMSWVLGICLFVAVVSIRVYFDDKTERDKFDSIANTISPASQSEREAYLRGCGADSGNGANSYCNCLVDKVYSTFTRAEVRKINQDYLNSKTVDPRMAKIADECSSNQ